MSSLYRRATPQQAKILRIVEGAVKNAANAHPEHQVTPQFARSIAKRAAGTLTAQWPDVLAAKMPPEMANGAAAGTPLPPRSQPRKAGVKGARQSSTRSLLKFAHNRLGVMAGNARNSGDISRYEALADALRLIASLRKEYPHV